MKQSWSLTILPTASFTDCDEELSLALVEVTMVEAAELVEELLEELVGGLQHSRRQALHPQELKRGMIAHLPLLKGPFNPFQFHKGQLHAKPKSPFTNLNTARKE